MIKLQSKRTKKIYYAYKDRWENLRNPTVECFDKEDYLKQGPGNYEIFEFPRQLLEEVK